MNLDLKYDKFAISFVGQSKHNCNHGRSGRVRNLDETSHAGCRHWLAETQAPHRRMSTDCADICSQVPAAFTIQAVAPRHHDWTGHRDRSVPRFHPRTSFYQTRRCVKYQQVYCELFATRVLRNSLRSISCEIVSNQTALRT